MAFYQDLKGKAFSKQRAGRAKIIQGGRNDVNTDVD